MNRPVDPRPGGRTLGPFRRLWAATGICVFLAGLTVAVGLVSLRLVPVSPPDDAFAARVAMWRALGPTPR